MWDFSYGDSIWIDAQDSALSAIRIVVYIGIGRSHMCW